MLNFLIRTPNSATFKKNNNPFKVADDYLAAILQLTSALFAAFVLSLEDSIKQGRRLK